MADLRKRLHSQCMLCGADHPQGISLAFSLRADGCVEAPFSCEQRYQGYSGYLHGGIISALLDSAMTNCLFAHGCAALTGALNVRFLKPIVVNRNATVTACVAKSAPPLFYMTGEMLQNGRIMATASATFMDASGTTTPLAETKRSAAETNGPG